MNFRNEILKIRSDYLKGKIDFDTAKGLVNPLLVTMNDTGLQIAKEHGKKFKKLTFNYVFR